MNFIKGWKGFAGVMVFCVAGLSQANTVDEYLQEARKLSKEGNFLAAAIHYKKVLKLESGHAEARREFKDLLLEAKRVDPEAEYSEVEWGLVEHSILESR